MSISLTLAAPEAWDDQSMGWDPLYMNHLHKGGEKWILQHYIVWQ